MLVGILSDSHGDARMTARAIDLLEERGASKLFHCGDLCGEAVLDALVGHDCTFVWGNCDTVSPLLTRYVRQIGLTPPEPPVRLVLCGKTIAVYHGHERDFATVAQKGGCDYLFYGHTHRYHDQRVNGCRAINPGALYRAAVHTVALLDVERDDLQFLCVEDGRPVSP